MRLGVEYDVHEVVGELAVVESRIHHPQAVVNLSGGEVKDPARAPRQTPPPQ
jgi:hypothetical protein